MAKADYWKSQARKYCDFCKCWIADNKPSVEFHEKGKRHQENVAKKLKFISKKSRQNERENFKMDAALQQMNSAALDAYKKDIENNADLTAINITKQLEEAGNSLNSNNGGKVWRETKAKDGNIYYWNTVTNETSWEPPVEGFLSLKEQEQLNFDKTKQQMSEVEKQRRLDGRLKMQQMQQEEMEEKTRLAREKMKERRVEEEPETTISGPIIPAGKTEPYGKWRVVEEKPKIDLQLPNQQYYANVKEEYEQKYEEETEPLKKEFKEKTIESLGEGENTTFKKRKFNNSGKRNVRQRLDND